jgi:predicted MFS family arabinose efflux permease
LNSREKMPPTTQPRFFYGWYVVAAAWFLLFLTGALSAAIFFKPILEEFQLDRATLSSVQTTALIVFAISAPFLGRLIDRFGPKAMLFVSATCQTLTSVVNGLATNLWHLYIGRYLLEIRPGHGTQVLINRWFVKKRGRALGILSTGIPIGILVLSPVSQHLVDIWGWRDTLLFWAVVTCVTQVPLILLIRNNPEDKDYAPDGEPLYGAKPTHPSPELEIEASPPKLTTATGNSLTEAARTGSFWLLSASQLLCGSGCGFIYTHIVIFATDMGYSAMIGASLLSVMGCANLFGVLLTGHMSDRTSRSKVLSLTHIIRSLSFFTVVIFILLSGTSLWLLYVAIALFGFGFFTTAPLASGLIADLFGNLRMGTIIGVTLACHMIGMAIGAYAGGITFELTGSYYRFFIIQGVLEFLAAIFAFAIKQPNIH